MARLARVVMPGMPHQVTQRGNRRQQTFFGDGDYAAYRRGFAAGGGRGAPPLHATHQFPPEMAGLLVARTFRFVCHGRIVPVGGGAVRGTQPGSGRPGSQHGAMALEQCAVTLMRSGRLLSEGRSVAGDGRGLEEFLGQCGSRGGTSRAAPTRTHRPATRRRAVSRSPGTDGWSHPTTPERRPTTEASQNSITCSVSPEFDLDTGTPKPPGDGCPNPCVPYMPY